MFRIQLREGLVHAHRRNLPRQNAIQTPHFNRTIANKHLTPNQNYNYQSNRIIILGIILNNIPLWRLSVGGRLARPFPNYTSSKTKPRRIQFQLSGVVLIHLSPKKQGGFRHFHTFFPHSVKLFLRSFLDLTSIVFLWQALVRSRVERGSDALLTCSLRRIRGDR